MDFILLLSGFIILIGSGELLVKGASSIALKADISPIVVGMTVVAFGTSSPELLICFQSAYIGSPDLAMGNVVGSNICNLGLVLGSTAIFCPILVEKESKTIYWPVTMGATLLLYLFCQDYLVDHWEGGLYIALLTIFITLVIRYSRKQIKSSNRSVAERMAEIPGSKYFPMWKMITFVIIGSLGLYLGSEWLIKGAKGIAQEFSISERVIGITILALGTSLPELATSSVAAFRKNTDMAAGNLLGSNIFNIFSIIGLTSIVHEIAVNPRILQYDFLWMLGITLLVLPIMLIWNRISRLGGIVLMSVYLLYTYNLIRLEYMHLN